MAMFDSIKNWLNRTDQRQADKQRLEAEAKDFRLPGEVLPQVFKYLFFIGLGFLNYRLFSRAVPGLWGQSTGLVAVDDRQITKRKAERVHSRPFVWRRPQKSVVPIPVRIDPHTYSKEDRFW